MSFNSYDFVVFFLPIAIILYFAFNRVNYTIGKVVLLACSLFFVCYQGVFHGIIVIVSMLINFAFYRGLEHSSEVKRRNMLLTAGIVFNAAVLCFFKFNSLVGMEILFPLGISFYTFMQIAFLVDSYRRESCKTNLLDYSLFNLFFPKFVQGPITYSQEIVPALGDVPKKRFSFDSFSKGVFLFSIGLAKKVLIADNFSIIADYGYQNIVSLNSYEAILTILAYTFQLYFDFSGYSDMAIGVGYMFNIKLPFNFDSPYKSRNVTDFWKRWHITLTRFLTKYIYIPLGGNRKGVCRTYVNIFIVFVISGLWHGTGGSFLIWGCMHGVASVLYRIFKKQYDMLPIVVQWIINFIYINIAWVFFRAGSATSAVHLLKQVFCGGWEFGINAALTESLLQPTFISAFSRILSVDITVLLGFAVALFMVVVLKNTNERVATFHSTVKNWLITYVLLVWSILSLSGVSSFLYTNF